MLCPNCFIEKSEASVCPDCGYDEAERRSPYILPYRTLLNNQYLVGRVLGKPGGFGITYLGWDIQLNNLVAVKEYIPRDVAGRDTDQITVMAHTQQQEEAFEYGLNQFLQEARTMAKFDHPNLVRIRSFFRQNGTAYLVMDYYQGLTLAEYVALQGGRLAQQTAVDIMMPIMDGLREIHDHGFLHRDVKPQNIYLTETGRPILLDFGAARAALTERSLSIVMTPGYAPPEQYHRKGGQGPWTDIYACAATLYYLVSGVTPLDGTERAISDDLESLDKLAEVSPQFAAAVCQAMAVNSKDRPQSMREFQVLLTGDTAAVMPPPLPDSAVGLPPVGPPLFPPATPVPSGPEQAGNCPAAANSRKILWIIIAAIVVLGAMAGLFSGDDEHVVRTMNFAGGAKYVGQAKNNKMHGSGTLTFPDGSSYEGQFVNGVISGQGTLYYKDGGKYAGGFLNGKRSGRGKLYNPQAGLIYEGMWKNDLKDGQGRYTYADGSVYEGQFAEDRRNGQGKMIMKNGAQYTGQFIDNKMSGIGVVILANGARYEGEFKNNKYNGYGVYYWTNGDKYEGEWLNGTMHGEGVYTKPDGRIYRGLWVKGKYIGR